MNTISDFFGAPGLTAKLFYESISDEALRSLFDPKILSVLDAIEGGHIGGEKLRKAAAETIDLADLLGQPKTRKQVLELLSESKQAELVSRVGRDITSSDRWTPSEVKEAIEFFGLMEERIAPPPPAAESSVKPAYGLFEHQLDAVRRVEAFLRDGDRRVVLHLPTGVGKTRAAMHVVAEWLRAHNPSVVAWLASGKELLEQAEEAFHEAWHHLGDREVQFGRMWSSQKPELANFKDGFLAAGLHQAQSVKSNTDSDWATRISSRVRLVVFDEAHQAIAKTYRSITDELTLNYRCALLGLTATPGRTWADIDQDRELADFFRGAKVSLDVPGKNPIKHLVENGFLARPKFRTLFAEPGLKLSSQELKRVAAALEIPDDIVGELTMSQKYVAAVLQAVEELIAGGHSRVLLFAASVNHAKTISAILATRDIRSAVVTGDTAKTDRNRAVRSFKSEDSRPMILVNFGVFTTGFDAPKATAVVIARPTKSLVLYSQMVGRAIRGPKAGGTETCEIITVVDTTLPGFGDIASAFTNWEDVW